jgi:hypothetical protein
VCIQLRAHRLDHVDLRREDGAPVALVFHQGRVLEVLGPDAGDQAVALKPPPHRVGELRLHHRQLERLAVDLGWDEVHRG